MSRGLFWKEWRELRILRWLWGASALVATVIVPGLVAATTSYGLEDSFLDLAPIGLGWLVLPLAALMSVVQSLTGDRARGSEDFFLQRPVSRTRLFSARLGASLLTTLVVALVGSVPLLAEALLLDQPIAELLGRALVPGAAIGLAAWCGGTLAATLLASALPALLVGAVFGSLPILAGAYLIQSHPWASVGPIALGLPVAAWLVLAEPIGAWTGLCRGEPAGRGRIFRAASTTVVLVAFAGLAFVILAPLAVRSTQPPPRALVPGHLYLQGGEGAGVAFIIDFRWHRLRVPLWGKELYRHSGHEGWLLDRERGEVLRYLPPPIRRFSWNDSGTLLAVVTRAGPLGAERRDERVVFLSVDGEEVRTYQTGTGEEVLGLRWLGKRLLLALVDEAGDGRLVYLRWVDPGTGATQEVEGRFPSTVLYGRPGIRRGDRLYLAVPAPGTRLPGEGAVAFPYGLHPLNREGSALEPDVLVQDTGPITLIESKLSPSGRYWVRWQERQGRRFLLVEDLAENEVVLEHPLSPYDDPSRRAADLRWLAGDCLVWLEGKGPRIQSLPRIVDTVAFLWTPRGAAEELRTFPESHVELRRSPTREWLVFEVHHRDSGGPGGVGLGEVWLWRPGSEWRELEPADQFRGWIGPRTLAWQEGARRWWISDVDDPLGRRPYFREPAD